MSILLLVLWVAIASLLRFAQLSTKPVWADEFSTLVFSLGNRYQMIPLDQVLTLNDLLQPLQPNSEATPLTVIHALLTESNHPPVAFVLMHLWLKLFPPIEGWVSVTAARSLSALWGVVAVPAMYGWGWLTFRSRLMAHLAAGLMALSPFAVYLAQEARHYTLGVLWVLASLACLVAAGKRIQTGQRLGWRLCGVWIGVNGLGIATHYFVLLALVAEGVALVLWLIWLERTCPQLGRSQLLAQSSRVLLVAGGTTASALVWLPVLVNIRGTELTRWIQRGELDHSTWLDHLLRSLAALISMLYLLPIQGIPTWGLVLTGLVAALLLSWTVPLLWRGATQQMQTPETASMLVLLGSFVGAVMGLSLLLTFGLGINFSSVFRYQFINLPAVLLLLAACLEVYWGRPAPLSPGGKTPCINGRVAIAIVLGFSLLGGLTVVGDWGYQRTHRPDQVAVKIDASFQPPTLIAIPHRTHAHSSRLMALAWELHRLNPEAASQSRFLLAHHTADQLPPAIASLQAALPTLPTPFQVWRVNFRSQLNPLSHTALTQSGCRVASPLWSVDGYRYQRYDCPELAKPARPESEHGMINSP